MTFINVRPSDRAPVIGRIAPISQGAGTVTTGWFSMADFATALATLQVGVLGASATVDAKLQQATDSSGTGAKDITAKAITQLTKAGSDDNKEVQINLRSEELDVANGFDYARLSVTVGTAASLVSAVVLGFDARYAPAADLSSVDEIIN